MENRYTDPKTGKFRPGNPGGGRPVGSLGKGATARARIMAQAEAIVDVLLEKAKAGDNAMLGLAMQVISPAYRAEMAPVQIPGASEAIASGRFEDALALISQASLDGTISPDAAKTLTEQLKASEEAKRISVVMDQINLLREKVINGRVVEHKPIIDASVSRIEEQPMRMISHG